MNDRKHFVSAEFEKLMIATKGIKEVEALPMTREQQVSHNLNAVANTVVQQTLEGQKDTAADIRALAKCHQIAYTETATDA